MIALAIRGLGHAYRPGHPVFADLDVSIPANRRIALLGGPGSGKTTLLQIIAGLIAPQAGGIVRTCRLSFPAGYQRGFRLAATARQNIGFAARIYGADPDEVGAFVERVADLGGLMDRPMRELAAAERLTVSYALAYAIPFDTYLFDNHVAVGSPAFRERCLAMYEARSLTAGTIVATRHPRVAEQLCDCALLLHDKRIDVFEDVAQAAAILRGASPATSARADARVAVDEPS